MVEIIELVLVWAIVVTIGVVILAVLIVNLKKKHIADIETVNAKLEKKQTQAFQGGTNFNKGQLNELLASFALLNEYQQLAVLSSVSKQFSLDLLGIKDDSVDFIEVKTKGAPLSKSQNNVKKLIDDKKVQYIIIDSELPKGYKMNERKKEEN